MLVGHISWRSHICKCHVLLCPLYLLFSHHTLFPPLIPFLFVQPIPKQPEFIMPKSNYQDAHNPPTTTPAPGPNMPVETQPKLVFNVSGTINAKHPAKAPTPKAMTRDFLAYRNASDKMLVARDLTASTASLTALFFPLVPGAGTFAARLLRPSNHG